MLKTKPRCRDEVKWWESKRKNIKIRKIVPNKTWKPWKPVSRKKTEPNTESAIEKVE